MDSSDEDIVFDQQPPAKKRKFAYKNLSQRIAEIDVNVYRELHTVRQEPLPGFTSFVQEEVQRWRELNTAEHFLSVAASLHGITQSLPLLLHHKRDIVDILLSNVNLDAKLSLEPILILLGTLARDLQGDFLPFIPEILGRLTTFVKSGGDSEPELLQHVFHCLALICKFMVKPIASDLPTFLKNSASLRYYKAEHIRKLSAATFSHLLRHCTSLQLKQAVRVLFAEHASKPTPWRADGVALILSETIRGVANGLHSRAPMLFDLIFRPDIFSKEKLTQGNGEASEERKRKLRSLNHTVVCQILSHTLEYTRRLKISELWSAILKTANESIDQIMNLEEGSLDAQLHLSNTLDWLAIGVEFHRGSRVEDFKPIFDLVKQMCKILSRSEGLNPSETLSHEFYCLPDRLLRLVQAVIKAHSQEAGASKGPKAIQKEAQNWSPLFGNATSTALTSFLMDFLNFSERNHSLILALTSLLIFSCSKLLGKTSDQESKQKEENETAMLLFLRFCKALQTHNIDTQFLLEDNRETNFLRACFENLSKMFLSWSTEQIPSNEREDGNSESNQGISEHSSRKLEIILIWIHTIPFLHSEPKVLGRYVSLYNGLLLKSPNSNEKDQIILASLCKQMTDLFGSDGIQKSNESEDFQKMYENIQQKLIREVIRDPEQHYIISALRDSLELQAPSDSDFLELTRSLEANLLHRSQALRRDSLRLLLILSSLGNDESDGVKKVSRKSIIEKFIKIESAPLTVDSGRSLSTVIDSLKASLEFNTIPVESMPLVIKSLTGALNIRLAPIWTAISGALSIALQYQTKVAWPLIIDSLRNVHDQLLSGNGASIMQDPNASTTVLQTSLLKSLLKSGKPEMSGGATDASVRMSHLLKAVSSASASVLSSHSKDWIPICLNFLESRNIQEKEIFLVENIDKRDQLQEEQKSSVVSHIGGRAWRAHLKEWLEVVISAKNGSNLDQFPKLRILVASYLTDQEAGVQESVLKVFKVWKIKFVTEHIDQLLRMADEKHLREELTSFPLSSSSENAISKENRPGLIAIITRVLWPKMRRRTGRLGGKGAPGSARKAILNFMSALDGKELQTLMQLFMQALSTCIQANFEQIPEEQGHVAEGLFILPWWADHLGNEDLEWWMKAINTQKLSELPLRVKQGFLNATEDLLRHLGHQIQDFLPEICSFLIHLLETAKVDTELGKEEGQREIRGNSLRIFADILTRFPEDIAFNPLWPAFFQSIEKSIERLPVEASSERSPAILEVLKAISSSQNLTPVLIDKPSLTTISEDEWHSRLSVSNQDKNFSGARVLEMGIEAMGSPQCSSSTQDTMLTVLESILNLEDKCISLVLSQHMHNLLSSLKHTIVHSSEKQGSKRSRVPKKGEIQKSSGRKVSMRALQVLESLSAMENGCFASEQLTEALLALISPQKKRQKVDETLAVRALNILSVVWNSSAQNIGNKQSLLETATKLSPLAKNLSGREGSLSLANAYSALSQNVPEFKEASEILSASVAYSTMTVDDVDYDARLKAYRRLSPDLWRGLVKSKTAQVLIYRAFLDLQSGDDLSLRHASSHALSNLLNCASLQKQFLANGDLEGESRKNSEIEIEGELQNLVMKLVLPSTKRGIGASNLAVRQEHLTLLRSICLQFPDSLAGLVILIDKDPEQDFFTNIAHLQMHRRVRALHRLAKAVEGGKLASGILIEIAIPILSQMIREGRSKEAPGHELKDSDRDKEANVTDTAIWVLGQIASVLSWPQYKMLLNSFLRHMNLQSKSSEPSKGIIRAVCSIVDAFHFHADLDQNEFSSENKNKEVIDSKKACPENPQQEGEIFEEKKDEDDEVEDTMEALGESSNGTTSHLDIIGTLKAKVLPSLEASLVVKSKDAVRPGVALALVKLLKILPESFMQSCLPRILQSVANLLKSRLQRIRDDARKVLASVMAELGPKYIDFMLDILESALPEKGYMGHIRGYTIHYVLEGMSKNLVLGAFDDCLQRVLDTLPNQLFGEVSEEKDANVFGHVREAKRMRAFDTYEQLARGITFRTHLAKLLSLVRDRLNEAGNVAMRSKLLKLLDAAQKGLSVNETVTPENLLIFVNGVLETQLPPELEAIKEAEDEAQGALEGKEGALLKSDFHSSIKHQGLIVELALSLLHKGIKKGQINTKTPKMISMLDPLLPHLTSAMKSRHSGVVEYSLRILSQLVQSPLPGLSKAAPEAGFGMTNLLQKSPNSSSRIAQECLRVFASLLRVCSDWAPTTSQLRFLVTWSLSDIEEAASQVAAFNLLRAIISRKLVIPEVYDVMNNVEDIMIRSQSLAVRQLCSSTFLQFLLDYPVGEKRFRQHLHKLIANLSYEHEIGRLSALDLTLVLINKLPKPMLENYAPVIFMPLVVQLTSDGSAKCRQEVGKTLIGLIKAVNAAQVSGFAEYCIKWMEGEDSRLKIAALQVYGLLVDSAPPQFNRQIRILLQKSVLTDTLCNAQPKEDVDEGDIVGDDLNDPETRYQWQETYYALSLLIKIMRRCPKEMYWAQGTSTQELWAQLPDLILHEHLWIRKLVIDLLGLGFADKTLCKSLLGQDGYIPMITRQLYRQLEASSVEESFLNQTAKCLIFLVPHLNSLSLTANEDKDGEDERGLSLAGLIRRMSKIADDRTFPRQTARIVCIKFLAALTSRLGSEDIRPFLSIILRPLYRISEGSSPTPPEVKELSEEVLGHIRKIAGSDAVLDAYNEARNQVTQARTERKKKQAIQAMLDPQAFAQTKINKQNRKAAGKKRKMEELARQRSVGLAVKNKRMRREQNAE